MDDQRIGRTLRALRHRLGWRQQDVAAKAGLSQDVVSRTELGLIAQLSVGRLRAIANALGAEVVISVRWRGAQLDRLLDEGHATLVGAITELLAEAGWEVRPEVSFSNWGERGAIDLLAWHPVGRCLLVVEVKTELASLEETIRRLDVKVRWSSEVAGERFGWRPSTVAHMLVLPGLATQRRQVARHAAVLDKVFPVRSHALRNGSLRRMQPSAGSCSCQIRAAGVVSAPL